MPTGPESRLIRTEAAGRRRPVLIGAGGHAAVLVDLLADPLGRGATDVPALAVDPKGAGAAMADYPDVVVLSSDAEAGLDADRSIELVNGIGATPGSARRADVHRRYAALGHRFASVLAGSALVSDRARLGEGVQLLHGSCIQRGARIGDGAIVNTRAVIEHDCHVGAHVHVAPCAVLCGAVRVGDGAFVGAGAVVLPGVAIGRGALIGAGVTVRRDVAPATRFVG